MYFNKHIIRHLFLVLLQRTIYKLTALTVKSLLYINITKWITERGGIFVNRRSFQAW